VLYLFAHFYSLSYQLCELYANHYHLENTGKLEFKQAMGCQNMLLRYQNWPEKMIFYSKVNIGATSFEKFEAKQF